MKLHVKSKFFRFSCHIEYWGLAADINISLQNYLARLQQYIR